MLDKFDSRPRSRPNSVESIKRPRLSLNLHIMPQVAGSHWKKWLLFGFLSLAILALIVFIFYMLAQ